MLAISARLFLPPACLAALLVTMVAAAQAPVAERAYGSVHDKLTLEEAFRFRDLSNGKRPAGIDSAGAAESDRAVLAKAARWYAYRLTWPTYWTGRDEVTMNDLVQEACRRLPLPERRRDWSAEKQTFLDAFAAELLRCLNDVIKHREVIVRLNAARIMAHLAAVGHEPVADALVLAVNNDAESDAIKLYALRGLKCLFALSSSEHAVPADAGRRQRCIAALLTYLHRAPALATGAPRAEVDGYRYVRREAVRALSQSVIGGAATGLPAAPAVEATLAQVLSSTGLSPGASVSEQLEAAIGVCHLPVRRGDAAQVDAHLQQVGRFIVDLLGHYSRHLQGFGDVELPWKLAAVRLALALDHWHELASDTPHAARYDPMLQGAKELLAALEKGRPAPQTIALERWLQQNAPRHLTTTGAEPAARGKVPPASAP